MISYNSQYLLLDGKPYYPVMGEMHYSRTKREDWHRTLLRMKSGGVDIVSSYVIWIHHEEVEGEYDFSGNKSLRDFVKEIGRVGLKMFLRIGPWVHAEVRNGGFPDFMLKKDFVPRTNDERYFDEVEKFYKRVYIEVFDQFYPNGPIVGVQIENEYGHCGGLTGEEGESHMRRLKKIAEDIGYRPQLFTATGWGGAVTGGMLPVMGAYCDAPWDEKREKLAESPNYLISYERNDKNIGSDMGLGYGLTFDTGKFPYLMAELGGGLQGTGHRRVVASAADTGAMTLCKIAGGCNLLGYYMYAGGTNPHGKLTTLEESRASGSLNDMPRYNYDCRAPLRQYGQFSESYKEIKLFTTFIHDFGEALCKMDAYVFEDNAKHADDKQVPRYSIRHDGKSGYVFINNYVRGYDMPRKSLDVSIALSGKTIKRRFEIAKNSYGFYPLNMSVNGAMITSANVTPLCVLNDTDYVFYTFGDENPEFTIDGKNGGRLITIPRSRALNCNKITVRSKDYLVETKGYAIGKDNGVEIIDGEETEVCVYKGAAEQAGWTTVANDVYNTILAAKHERRNIEVAFEELKKPPQAREYSLTIDYNDSDAIEALLDIDYCGNKAEIYVEGDIVNDDFYNGKGFEIDLIAIGRPKEIKLRILELKRGADIYFEYPPIYENDIACKLNGVKVKCQYKYFLELK